MHANVLNGEWKCPILLTEECFLTFGDELLAISIVLHTSALGTRVGLVRNQSQTIGLNGMLGELLCSTIHQVSMTNTLFYDCDLNNLSGIHGKHLLIYNCDAHCPNPKEGAKAQLIGPMHTLLTQGSKKEYSIQSFWYGCGLYPAPTDQGLCVEYTMSWLRDIASQLESPFLGSDDPRVQGFTHIIKV